jgi:hypothetical protein
VLPTLAHPRVSASQVRIELIFHYSGPCIDHRAMYVLVIRSVRCEDELSSASQNGLALVYSLLRLHGTLTFPTWLLTIAAITLTPLLIFDQLSIADNSELHVNAWWTCQGDSSAVKEKGVRHIIGLTSGKPLPGHAGGVYVRETIAWPCWWGVLTSLVLLLGGFSIFAWLY